MFRKSWMKIMVVLIIISLASACTGDDEEYWDDEAYDETEGTFTATEVPLFDETSLSTCQVIMNGMVDSDVDEDVSTSYDGQDIELDEEVILVTYQISGDEIHSPEYAQDVPDDLVPYQEDSARHQEIWEFVTALLPAEERTILGEFIIFSDGADNVLGAVDDADTASLWTLEVDIIDSQDLAGLSTTLIHEFGHMVTMNDNQVGDEALFCTTYASIDGCSEEGSYLNAFYDIFWSDIHNDWSQTTNDGDEDLIEDFYTEYSDQFVSDYAATSPEEDIAETWTYFVFYPYPVGNSIADQKIQFFYDYPELVEIRQQIINGLCPYLGD